MSLHIPSSNVRSSYLKKLPVGYKFTDPKNKYAYQVIEKELNNTYVKSAIPYLGNEEAVEIQIPLQHLKQSPTKKVAVLHLLKQRVLDLEKQVKDVQSKSTFQQIKDRIGDANHHETHTEHYFLHNGMVLPIKKSNASSLEEAQDHSETMTSKLWKDTKLLPKAMQKQHSVQAKLLQILVSLPKEVLDETVKVISFG